MRSFEKLFLKNYLFFLFEDFFLARKKALQDLFEKFIFSNAWGEHPAHPNVGE
jgi:hypothetical protein